MHGVLLPNLLEEKGFEKKVLKKSITSQIHINFG